MKVLLQRVQRTSVTAGGRAAGSIGGGLLALVGMLASAIGTGWAIGHARRRHDGMPKLVEKFKINLARQFPTRQQQRILDVSLDRARLEQMPVNEYMDLFII